VFISAITSSSRWALLLVGVGASLCVSAKTPDYRGFRDEMKMVGEPGEPRDLSNAFVSFTSDAAEQAGELGLPFVRIVSEIRESTRVRWVDPDPVKNDRLQIFLNQRGSSNFRYTVKFTHRDDEAEVFEVRPFSEDDRWAWDWSNYQTFFGDPALGELMLSRTAMIPAVSTDRPLRRGEIERAFAAPIGPPVAHPDYPNLKWHIGVSRKKTFVSLIYRDGLELADRRVYRADRASFSLIERFLALARSADLEIAPPPDIELVPNLRQKLAWRHQVTWPEFLEALASKRPLVPDPRPETRCDDIERHYYVTSLESGKPMAVCVAPTVRGSRVITAYEASQHRCQSYLAALRNPSH
jgi:hypothetical protein